MKGYQCDGCQTFGPTAIDDRGMFRTEEPPEGWLIVKAGKESKHFCGPICLAADAQAVALEQYET